MGLTRTKNKNHTMKNYQLLALLFVFLLGACSESNLPEESITKIYNTLPDLATDLNNTRTYAENDKNLRWHEDDRLTAFYGNTLNRQYKFNGKTGDNSGSFSHVPSGDLETGNTFDRIYAVYPYDETATITEEGVISLTLPAEQQYAENSFGKGANTMIAVTESREDTFLAFRNACGYLKLKLYAPEGGVVKSIEVKGNNNEKIAGNATATIAFGEAPVVTMADGATTSVTLDCGEGISLGTTDETAIEFWVTIPETTFTDGITIKATDCFGATFTKSTDKEIKIERNTIQPMVALKFDGIKPQPDNEIWYTSSDGIVVKPYNADAFGANIISNTYENGKGIITFDGDVSKIGYSAFRDCTMLSSVAIPESVTSIGNYAFYACSSLMDINIPNKVSSIGNYAFAGCSSLIDISIPNGVTSIEQYTFSGCSSLCNVDIPRSVISIGSYAFNKCFNLSQVLIHDTLILIGKYAFYQSGLISVDIPYGSIATISERAFSECASLVNVKIDNGVTIIDSSAFRLCKKLEKVDLPYTIQTIETAAFGGCYNLKEVYCRATTRPEIWYKNNTSGSPETFPLNSEMKIYVPREAYYVYKEGYSNGGYDFYLSDRNWWGYISYIEPYDFED